MESRYLNLTGSQRTTRRRKGIGNYLYVRYADDFIVLCNGTKAEALAMKEELKELLSTMGLTLSEEKTKVTHLTEGFIFLGYKIIRAVGETGKIVPKVLVPESATKKFRHKIRELLAPKSLNESVQAKMMALNRFTRGWCNYYKCTSSPYVIFWKLNPEVFWGMAHWLGRKRQRSMPRIMQEYRRESTLGYKSMNLVMPTEIKSPKTISESLAQPLHRERGNHPRTSSMV
jgi:RNA-directed DNA polymerase